MYIDYAKINAAKRETPMLRLRTLTGQELGPIPYVYGLSFAINYTDLSTIEFSVPRYVNGRINPLYAYVTGYKEVYTDNFGIYTLTAPSTENDGVAEVKTVKGYSREYAFHRKKLFLEEGTYNFWNPASPEGTILSRITELDPTWTVGYVAPRLIGCYRTFDEYRDGALDFLYGDVMEKYRCAIVFDVYNKTINAYDAGEDRGTLPIYLNFKNLVENTETEELTDELVTKLHVYGADDLSIREVNPTGEDYLVDLSAFLENGDLDVEIDGQKLSDRVRAWQDEIAAEQPFYTGLTGARASLTAEKLAAQAELTERRNEADTLTIQQSAIIQALSLETTPEGKQEWQGKLDDINRQIAAQEARVTEQETRIEELQTEIDGYAEKLRDITGRLSWNGYFTENERKVLNNYLIEDDLEESTFVASDIDTGDSGAVSTLTGSVALSGAAVTRVDVEGTDRTLYAITGGRIACAGIGLDCQVVRGTLDTTAGRRYVLTGYLGETAFNGHSFQSGLLTVSGELTDFDSDIVPDDPAKAELAHGTRMSFSTTGASVFFTVNVSEFQRYSVALELFDYGREVLREAATPTYEFSVDTANYLYQQEFAPFKDRLELGKSVYLDVGSHGLIKPRVIGLELDFEDITELKLIFSNRYKLSNGMENWREEIRAAGSSGRSFDARKYIYNRWAEKSTAVTDFMNGNLDAAKNTILGAENQSVWADSAGLHIGQGPREMRLVDSMIAMTDDGWKTARMALGRFATPETGEVWGINGELVAGNLFVGNNLVIQNPTDDGIMQFKVDATGAWLYNSRHVLQGDNGLIVIDPKYGIAAGTKLLLDANGTVVTPEFLNEAGEIEFDEDGLPKNANFLLDMRDGNAYFRGTVYAKDGVFNGTVYAKDGEFTGKVTATSGTFKGRVEADSGFFKGDITGASGTFGGTLRAARYEDASGNDMMNTSGQFKSDYLDVRGLNVNNRFKVDENGNVTITGGSISFSAFDSNAQKKVNDAQTAASSAQSTASSAWSAASTAQSTAESASSTASAASRTASSAKSAIDNWTYGYTFNGSTYIDGRCLYTGTVTASNLRGGTVEIINGGNVTMARMVLGSTQYAGVGLEIDSIYGGMRFQSAGNVFLEAWDGYNYGPGSSDPYIMIGSADVSTNMSFVPSNDSYQTLGSAARKWSTVYASSGQIQTSDRELKHDIEPLPEKYLQMVNRLEAVRYKYNDGTSNRFHVGFVAQDVKAVMDELGIDSTEFGGYVVDVDESSNPIYMLRYEEFIGIVWGVIRWFSTKLSALETLVYDLSA